MLKSTKRFTLHTDGLNSQGFRMLTSGADMTDFLKNPVLLFNHIRPKGNKKDQILPLGYWEDIELKDGQITGVPVFDDKDEFAKAIFDKVEAGIIKMCSMGAEPIETSNAQAVLLPGQKLETVTKWKAKEGSICDIGANPDSLAVELYDSSSKRITLAESPVKTLPSSITPNMKKGNKAAATAVKTKVVELSATLKTELKDIEPKVADALTKHMVKLADDLEKKMSSDDPEKALADDPANEIAGDDDKDKKISELTQQLAACQEQLRLATEKIAAAEGANADDKATKLADTAYAMRKITLAEKPAIIRLAKADYEGTVAMLKERKAQPTIQTQLENVNEGEKERVVELSKKPWDDLFKETGALEFLKLNAPEVYKAKYKTKFNKEPKNL